ncbi:MAG: ATP-binding protein [Lachnospiraceae bacterium]|nr:ATP-binding protein [Lachnospiraceae bacterium]
MKNNPYTLLFGKEPIELISRPIQKMQIIDAFEAEPASQQIFIITGVRGAGKTVLMTEVANTLANKEGWVVVELNPERDMLQSLASKLSSENRWAKLFQASKINLSFFGLGLEVSGEAPITDIETALSKMLESLQKHDKKLLITVDEAVSSKEMRTFVSSFQILVRQNLPVYLLMTGLYENINVLQNEKSLTFLYRAPKIELKPLNLGLIADSYAKNIGVSEETSLSMAKLTKGYSFAFQVLGHFAWEERGMNDQVIVYFKQYLDDYVYEKIWSELSKNDQKIAYAIASVKTGRVVDVRNFLGLETNQFNPYRDRLVKRGLVDGSVYGYVIFTLPLFERYVLEHYYE